MFVFTAQGGDNISRMLNYYICVVLLSYSVYKIGFTCKYFVIYLNLNMS